MLYIFIGDDVLKAKAEVAKRAQSKEVVRFGEGGEPFENVGGYLEQQGMFSPALALVLDRPLDDPFGKELLLERGDVLVHASAEVFVIEPHIGAVDKKKLPKGAKLESFDISSQKQDAPPLSAFALVDAVQSGDRKRAWILFRELIESGASPEEIHGALAWAARGVVLAAKTKSAAEAGMKPFPYNKAKGVARGLKPGDAEAESAELVDLYHRARMGQGTLEDLLEIYLLKR